MPSRASSSPRRARGIGGRACRARWRGGALGGAEGRAKRRSRRVGPAVERHVGSASSRKRRCLGRVMLAPASCVVPPLNRVALNGVVGGKCHGALAEASCRQQRARLSVFSASASVVLSKSEEERSAARPNHHFALGGEEAGRRPCCSRRCVRSVVFRRCTRRHALGGAESRDQRLALR